MQGIKGTGDKLTWSMWRKHLSFEKIMIIIIRFMTFSCFHSCAQTLTKRNVGE